jgi:predicted RNase H-like HicB family nuclease
MKIPVSVEQVKGNGYFAKALGLTTQAPTREEALSQLKQLMEAAPAEHGETVWLEVEDAQGLCFGLLQRRLQEVQAEVDALRAAQPNPWLRMAGIFKDDPYFDEWQQAIEDYRRQIDEDPNIP